MKLFFASFFALMFSFPAIGQELALHQELSRAKENYENVLVSIRYQHIFKLPREYGELFDAILKDDCERISDILKAQPSFDVNVRAKLYQEPDARLLFLEVCGLTNHRNGLVFLLNNGLNPNSEDLRKFLGSPWYGQYGRNAFKTLAELSVFKKLNADHQVALVSDYLKADFRVFPRIYALALAHGLDIFQSLSPLFKQIIKEIEKLNATCYGVYSRGKGSFSQPEAILNYTHNIRALLEHPSCREHLNGEMITYFAELIASTGTIFIMQLFLEKNLMQKKHVNQSIDRAKHDYPTKHLTHELGIRIYHKDPSKASWLISQYKRNRNKPFIARMRRFLILCRIFSQNKSKDRDLQDTFFKSFPIPYDMAHKIACFDLSDAPFIDPSIVTQCSPSS